MDVKRYTPCNIGRTINRPIMLGKVGEQNALRIEFGCEEWLTDYPNATIDLYVKRPDNDGYHAAMGEDGYNRIWIIDERAVLTAGNGTIELILKDAESGTKIKSETGYTTVASSPSAGDEPSDLGFIAYNRQQNLTEAQKRVARTNIGAGTGSGDGTGGGTDGFSPTIEVVPITGGHRLIITDVYGEKTVDVMDGKAGAAGAAGAAGRGIVSVVRTSGNGSAGSTDTYTITYTDNTTSKIAVYNGRDGADGTNGVSPTIAVETISGGHRVTITDVNGTKSFDILDGKDGVGGEGGSGDDGEDGGYYIPSIDANGNLSWTASKAGMPTAEGANIKGTDGEDGEDGVSPTVKVTSITGGHRITITDVNGSQSFDVMNGEDGKDEAAGEGASVELDTTLSKSGKAADAKATGDALNELKEAIAKKANDKDLATVAKSGSYNDLKNKPTIPTVPEALKNPYPLTINGTAYDGSTAVNVTVGGGSTVNATPRMSNIIKAGTIFEKPDGLPYCGWPFNDVQYDPDINSIVFLINAAEKHGDNGKTHLYMGVMSLDTYDVTIKEIGNPDMLGHGFYTMGFCINSAGEYLYVDAQSATLGKSVDKGVTWTETDISAYSNWPESLTQLSNGRYLMWSDGSVNNGVLYSDDDCASWTPVTMTGKKAEGDFLELPGGVVMCFMRKSTNGTDNGAWSGTKIQEPIVISISRDYGTTWSAATDSTTLLEGCANIASAFYHADEDLVEVFTSPRYPYGDTYGAVFQYIATREDALNDRFGTPKVVAYSKAHVYQDFGHIGGCFDNLGDLHLMYYDGDGDASGAVNYHYLKASRGQATLPTVNDHSQSVFLPYSGNKVGNDISDVYKYVQKVRSELLIYLGQMPDSGDSDNPTYWITDGLIAQFDFSEDNFDPATSSFSAISQDHKDAKLYTEAKDGVYATRPLNSGTDKSVPLADLIQAAVLDPETGYTIELDVVGTAVSHSFSDMVIVGNEFYSWGNESLPSFSTTTARTSANVAKGKYWRGDGTRKASTLSYVVDRVNKRSYLYINGDLKHDSADYTVADGYSVDIADSYGISNRGNWTTKTWASPFMEIGSFDNKALRFYTRPLTAEEVAHNAKYANR